MINAKVLINAGIDYNAGMKRFLDNAEFYETVLKTFLSETMLERAETAYGNGDYIGLQKVVHEAKGSGGNAGLDLLYREAGALLQLLRSNSYNEEDLRKAFNKFSEVYLATKDAINLALQD